MAVHTKKLTFHMGQGNVVRDITGDVREVVGESGISNGTVTVQSGVSIGVITTLEYEPGCLADLEKALSVFAPFDPPRYEHTKRWHDENGHGHVRNAIMGSSETFVVMNGEICLETWQQIIFCDYCPNVHPHHPVFVCVMGE